MSDVNVEVTHFPFLTINGHRVFRRAKWLYVLTDGCRMLGNMMYCYADGYRSEDHTLLSYNCEISVNMHTCETRVGQLAIVPASQEVAEALLFELGILELS